VSKRLLDTNMSASLRKPKPDGAMAACAGGLNPRQIRLAAKAHEIEAWVDGLAGSFRILPMDGACFREWARLMHGKPDDLSADGMIAATARIHGLTVATRNTRDFSRLGVPVLDPFKEERYE
jgi:predicted nucleic acid-binding protein